MKVFTTALTALALTATVASASNFPQTSRNAEPIPSPSSAEQIQVPAGSVMTSHELRSAGYDADDLITVTNFPSSEDLNIYSR